MTGRSPSGRATRASTEPASSLGHPAGIPNAGAGPYSIGSDHVPGLSKLIEECGEVMQVAGKIIGFGSLGDHWDGTNLKDRLTDELGDLLAALDFVVSANGLDAAALTHRSCRKLGLFNEWHRDQRKPDRLQVARAEGYTEELHRTGRIA